MATKRVNINNLLPDTDYVVQVRAVNDAGVSKWSQKFNFKTIDDTVGGTRKPKTPTAISWTFDSTGFHGQWNEVTQNTDNSNAKIISYTVELTHSSAIRTMTVSPQEGTVNFDLPLQRAQTLFGVATIGAVSMRVLAVNASGNKSAWSSSYNASAQVPGPPTNGVIEELNEALKVSWDAPGVSANLAGYHVYVGTTSGFTPAPANRVYEGPATEFTYSTSTFVQHWFKIRSYSAWGQESTPDLVVTGTPKNPYLVDSTPPSVPTSLAVGVTRAGAVARADITWAFNETTPGNEDIMQFAIRWRRVGASNWFLDFADKAARAMSVDLPQPYANYEFQIATLDNVANYSAWSSVVTLTAGIAGAPPQTAGVTATPGLGSIQLSWTASAHDDVTYGGFYEVQVATNAGFSTGLLTYQTGNTSIAITGLPQSTVYYYRVRAVDVDGNQGTYSTVATVTTGGVVIPSATDGIAPSSSPAATVTAGLGALFVSWAPVSNADEVTYEVHVSVTNGFTPGPGTKAAETPGTIVTLRNTAGGTVLVYGTTYYVKIIAKDADGAAAAGTQGSGTPVKAGSSDITTITADQIGTSSLSAATITIDSAGVIQSNNYIANTSGFKLSATVVDIQSGIVNFGTLAAGTVTTTGLSIGAGGRLTVDSTGSIQSNNYAANSTGWKLSATGLELNGGSVKASALVGGTFTGGNFIVGSGGSITGTGFSLSSTGLSLTSGSIVGPSIQTNALTSLATDSTTGLPLFSINSGGYATLAGARILGNTVLGSSASSSHYIASYDWVSGSAGWKIWAGGGAEFNTATFRGLLSGATGTFSGSVTAGTALLSSGSLSFSTYGATISAGYDSFFSQNRLYFGVGGNSFTMYDGSAGTTFSSSISTFGGVSAAGAISGSTGTFASGLTVSAGDLILSGLPSSSTAGTVVHMGAAGRIYKFTSSERYKNTIKPMAFSSKALLALEPVTYYPNDGNTLQSGFIAEQAHRAGLGMWVRYENGRPEAFDYPGWTAAQQKVLREHEDRIDRLEAEIKRLSK